MRAVSRTLSATVLLYLRLWSYSMAAIAVQGIAGDQQTTYSWWYVQGKKQANVPAGENSFLWYRAWQQGSARLAELPEITGSFLESLSARNANTLSDTEQRLVLLFQSDKPDANRLLDFPLCFDVTNDGFRAWQLQGTDITELECQYSRFSRNRRPDQCYVSVSLSHPVILLDFQAGTFNQECTRELYAGGFS